MNLLWFMLALSVALNVILFIRRSEAFPGKKALMAENQEKPPGAG